MQIPRSDAIDTAARESAARLAASALSNQLARADGWESAVMGIGTSEDALTTLRYSGFFNLLTDPIVEVMFMTEPFSERGVTTYPDVAFSEGVRYTGVATDAPAKVTSYLSERWRVPEACTDGAIWGRLYGGAATWVVTDENLENLELPLEATEEILALRTIERPFCVPDMNPDTFDAAGKPTYFLLTPPQGRIHARVHVSRLVLWPGDLTPQRRRLMRGFWDMSCLQRPFDVLKRNGLISQSAMQLLKEASLGVLQIKDLWSSILAGNMTTIAKRIRLFNQARAQSRAIILDADKEKFERVNTTFAGVSDLTESQRQEVAMAFRIPLTRLMGTSAPGLSGGASGDAGERQFQKDVSAYQRRVLEQPVHKLCSILLNAPDSPCSPEGLTIQWPDLWAPSATESAQIYNQTAQGDAAYIAADVITPEQALKRFTPDGFQQEIDLTPSNPGDDEDDPAVLAQAEAENAAANGAAPGQPQAQLEPQAVSTIQSVISDVAAQKIPRDAAIALLSMSYGIDEQAATKLLGSAGNGFEPYRPPPPQAAAPGGKPPTPAPGRVPAPAKDDKTDAEERADHIVERGGKFVVLSEDNSREFGTYDTKAEAEKRLGAVEAFKHGT